SGYAIGGDSYANREGLLPKASGRKYYECDIDTVGYKDRGSRRIIYSNDGLIYYTGDHYEHFELLYGEE
ncbi:MAG: ribonuclease, partial [Erysipelotrichaceae bacterium]|nr:ribonuclease [Erysipelotrichaceae bacterium]